MGQFTDESGLIIHCDRTATRGNWVSIDWNGFQVKLSDDDARGGYSQIELKQMCLKCLNTLFG